MVELVDSVTVSVTDVVGVTDFVDVTVGVIVPGGHFPSLKHSILPITSLSFVFLSK